MSKQCLDIQQMQHLKELGVDISKASTSWYRVLRTGSDTVVTDWFPVFGTLSICAPTMRYETMPAFTLQDILDLLPKVTENEQQLRIIFFDNRNTIVKYDSMKYPVSFSCKDLIDSAYEMLCWCIENGYVETNKKDEI